MKLLQSALLAVVAARDLRDDFKPDKNYVDGVCKEKGPGTYTYSPTVCEHYIQCGAPGHVHHVMPCPAGTMYNEALGWCDYAENVPPPCGQKEDGMPDAEECSKGDGFYPNQLNCAEYFVCRNGQPMEMRCPENFSFDQVGKICTIDAFVSSFYCTPEKKVYGNPVTTQGMAFCADKLDGNYANPGVCHTFIKCWNQMGSEFVCPDNRVWNDRLNICDHPAFVRDLECSFVYEEEPEMDANELCVMQGKQGLFPVPGECHQFVQCYDIEGELHGSKKTCPDKLSFNPKIGVCDWPENLDTDCHNGKVPYDPESGSIDIPDVEDEVQEIVQDAAKFCSSVKKNGTFRDPHDCSVFYSCQTGGRSDKFHCPAGTVFNESAGYCDYADNLDYSDQCYHVNLYLIE